MGLSGSRTGTFVSTCVSVVRARILRSAATGNQRFPAHRCKGAPSLQLFNPLKCSVKFFLEFSGSCFEFYFISCLIFQLLLAILNLFLLLFDDSSRSILFPL